MHDLLMLRGEFDSRKNPTTPKGPQFDGNFEVKAETVAELRRQLGKVLDFFSHKTHLRQT